MQSQSRDSLTPRLSRSLAIAAFGLLSLSPLLHPLELRAQAPPNVTVHPAYQMRAVAIGLDFPTAITFNGSRMWICEAGIFDPSLKPAIKEVHANGATTTILTSDMFPAGQFAGPLTALKFHNGLLWVAHRYVSTNGWMLGAISKFDPSSPRATFVNVVTGLPSAGDHATEDIAFDATGRLYFSQGSASNSGVIGADNELMGQWLSMAPGFHDYPPTRIALSGASFRNTTPFALDPAASAVTAPFMKFNSGPLPTDTITILEAPSQLVPQDGVMAGNGAVYSVDLSSPIVPAPLKLEAWGLRNPYGLGFDPFLPNQIFVSNNGADTRMAPINGQVRVVESRPIENDWDDLFTFSVGGDEKFFGWPDYFHDRSTGNVIPVTSPIFCAQDSEHAFPCPDFILHLATRENLAIERAYAEFQEHVSANKFDFSTDADFRFVGDIFVAETGSFPPVSGAEGLVGHKVVRVDRATRTVSDFIAQRSNSPDQVFLPEGFNKPIDVKFRGPTMFVVDFGVFEPGLNLMTPHTGKIWMVELSAIGAGGQFTTTPIFTRPGTIQGPTPSDAPTFSTNAVPGSDPRRSSLTPTSVIQSRRTP